MPRMNANAREPRSGLRLALLALALCLCAAGAARAHAEDEVELLSGMRIKGTLISDASQEITFLSQGAQFTYPYAKIHALTVKGQRRVLNEKPAPAAKALMPARPAERKDPEPAPRAAEAPKPPPEPKAAAAAPSSGGRTKSEVDAEIQKVGATPPDWWNSVQLNYPKTLDLTMGPPPNKNWDPSKNVGQYFWSIINENPGKWKEGVRFAAHLMQVNQSDQGKVNEALRQMAHLYEDCLEDYARAAYCLIKKGDTGDERLAVCYYKLGCKDAAKDILTKYGNDDTRFGVIIKMWADMGEYETALKLADEKSRNGSADVGFLMMGDAYRQAGRYKEAL
ncbi:MAG: hypothetical protein KIS92_24665, partial [Planctomycetota bacterium]|nr:hypothetical protein [Planctomycetota bacterium]